MLRQRPAAAQASCNSVLATALPATINAGNLRIIGAIQLLAFVFGVCLTVAAGAIAA